MPVVLVMFGPVGVINDDEAAFMGLVGGGGLAVWLVGPVDAPLLPVGM